jgi:hypothetical protein
LQQPPSSVTYTCKTAAAWNIRQQCGSYYLYQKYIINTSWNDTICYIIHIWCKNSKSTHFCIIYIYSIDRVEGSLCWELDHKLYIFKHRSVSMTFFNDNYYHYRYSNIKFMHCNRNHLKRLMQNTKGNTISYFLLFCNQFWKIIAILCQYWSGLSDVPSYKLKLKFMIY